MRAVAVNWARLGPILLGGDRRGGAGVRRGRVTGRGARARPLDAVLDDATLEGVAGDSEELSGFDDAPGGGQGFHAEQSFSSVEVPIFEDEAHGGRIGEKRETWKDETVRVLGKNT